MFNNYPKKCQMKEGDANVESHKSPLRKQTWLVCDMNNTKTSIFFNQIKYAIQI